MEGVALCVQTERKSKFLLLSKIPDMSAPSTRDALISKMELLPSPLRKTLTLDNGTENAQHEMWRDFLTLSIYFCDPYCFWQKGIVENTIGLVRQYFPKGHSLDPVTPESIQAVQDRLNHRPRKTLGFKTPHEVLSAHCKRLGVRLRD
jgi:IS30 family transposase